MLNILSFLEYSQCTLFYFKISELVLWYRNLTSLGKVGLPYLCHCNITLFISPQGIFRVHNYIVYLFLVFYWLLPHCNICSMRTNTLPILFTIICQESSMVPGHIIGVQNKDKEWIKLFNLCLMLHCSNSLLKRIKLKFEQSGTRFWSLLSHRWYILLSLAIT